MAKEILQISDLVVKYKTDDEIVEAVNGIGLKIYKGETLGLVGETGAGKTTTALSIMGLVPNPPGSIESGKIVYEGNNLLALPEKEMRKIRGENITMIFQDPMTSLNPVLTVGQQIMEVLKLHSDLRKDELLKKTKEMLETVGIPGERYAEYPTQFSGGMKQRVMIAIALACNPRLLIADAPTTALDVTIQAQVLELMNKLKKEYDTAMLLITHDLGVVAEVCDKVAVMYAGEIVESGTLKDILLHMSHPYTKGLFESLPKLDEEVKRLKTISGSAPNPAALPSGCKFHDRCSCKEKICEVKNPESVMVGEEHFVKCHLFGESGGM